MKLRNKKTGEIIDCKEILVLREDTDGIWQVGQVDSLAELNSEWEDVPEEPKGYYYATTTGLIKYDDTPFCAIHKDRKAIGNYFETREEAEKAVEKLKAWKRLKDKGFRFEGWDNTDRSTIHNFSLFVAIEDLENINRDLDLLFSGEDD